MFDRLHMPSLGGATEWLNSEPLGPAELRGHVVLVNFWTLTCINWLRQERQQGVDLMTGALMSSQEVGKDVQTDERLSDQLERWLGEGEQQTLGSLLDMFGSKGFAVVFIVLMAPSALPLPTGGVTNVLEVVTMLVALELIVGKRTVWLPERWKRLDLGGRGRERFASALVRRVRSAERFSHPHLRFLFGHRLTGAVFGMLVLVLTLAAFVAPPFSGLDTLPSLGIVLLALGVVFENVFLAVAGFVIGALGTLLVIVLGSQVVQLIL